MIKNNHSQINFRNLIDINNLIFMKNSIKYLTIKK